MLKYTLLLITGTLLVATGVLWSNRFLPLVTVIRPEYGVAVRAVYATGTVEPEQMLPLAARATARITELLVDEGSIVKKGQLLARLEDADLQQTISELQAREIFAKHEYERSLALAGRSALSKSEHELRTANWKAARAALNQAVIKLEFLRLIAPSDGTIIRREGELGELIPAQRPVFWFATGSRLRISAEVDEEDIPLVQPGQAVLIRADSFPGQKFEGTVKSITPKGDPVARSYRVRVTLDGSTPLMIGMTAEANIVVSQKDTALLLPSQAVTESSVWLVSSGKLVRQKVQVGIVGQEKTEILDGLVTHDLVLTDPNAALDEGSSVRVLLKESRN